MGLLNPRDQPQDVVVTILGRSVTRTVNVSARGRNAVELGAWGLEGDFGVEVRCGSVCAASLTMWDAPYKNAHESLPIVGCVIQ